MGEKLSIAVFGSSLLSSYQNPLLRYFRGLFEAMGRLGCRITFYESDALDRPLHRDFECPEHVQSVVYPAKLPGVKACLKEAMENTVLIKIGGTGVYDETIEQSLLDHRRDGRAVIYWDTGGPALPSILRNRSESGPPRILREADLVLTCGGGLRFVRAVERLGIKQCLPIFSGLNPQTHFPSRAEEGILADFAFTADRLPGIEEKVEEYFLKPARQLPDRIFLLAGQGWQYCRSLPANVQCLGPLSADRQNILNSSSLAVLNILDSAADGYGPFVPDRFFEAAGAGACLLTEDFEGLENFLSPQSECIAVQDHRQVAEVLESLTIQTVRSLGHNARRRIRAEHTFAHRARKVVQALRETLPHTGRLTNQAAAG